MEYQQKGAHELHSRDCATVRCVHQIGTEVHEYPIFNITKYVVNFIKEFDYGIEESQTIPLINVTL